MSDASSLPPPPPRVAEGHPPPPPPTDPLGTYAGWWRRAWGRFLDTLLTTVVALLCFVPAFILFAVGETEQVSCYVDPLTEETFSLGEVEDLLEDNAFADPEDYAPNAVCEEITDGAAAIGGLAMAVGLVPLVLFMVWFYRRLGRTGQTPGRKVAGVKVVDAGTGEPVGGGRAFGREIVAGFSLQVLFLGYLWAAWDKRKQTWHDKVITTVVLRDERPRNTLG